MMAYLDRGKFGALKLTCIVMTYMYMYCEQRESGSWNCFL